MFKVLRSIGPLHSLWEYFKRFHCSFEWHLTPRMALSIESCIRRTLQHSPRVSAKYRFHCNNITDHFELSLRMRWIRHYCPSHGHLHSIVIGWYLPNTSRLAACENTLTPSYSATQMYRPESESCTFVSSRLFEDVIV